MGAVDQDFARLVGQLDYSMLIVTAAHGNDRDGCAATLVVHPVPEEAEELAVLFGGETGDEVDKFARCRWESGPDGTPVLPDVDSWFSGRVLGHVGFGDHVGFVLEPTVVHVSDAHDPLTFRRAPAVQPGHEP